ncbi:MAG: four helix bundle protein [Balneolaceae bacterium]|nr:four helix bundle protein [Balneolaceae bacterium]
MKKKSKIYDLETRTFKFAKRVRKFVRDVPTDLCNIEDCKQLIKSSGSVGANYIEANESLSKKDFKMRIKISRKESKETRYWLSLIDTQNHNMLEDERNKLIQESTELLKIFSAILQNSN